MSAPLKGVKPKEHRDLMLKVLAQGWTATVTGSGHIKLTPPDGTAPIIAAMTAGDRRGTLNLRSRLRRHGVDC